MDQKIKKWDEGDLTDQAVKICGLTNSSKLELYNRENLNTHCHFALVEQVHLC